MKRTLVCLLITLGLFVPNAYADDDLQTPSDVEGVTAVAGEGSVTLSWEMATDNVGVTGYKIYYGLDSVSEDGGTYTFGSLETDNVLEHVFEDLEGGVTYYFAITALDAAGNESEYYSYEASAAPAATAEDTESPYIVGAEALTDMVLEVMFSEDIELPLDGVIAFSIVNLETGEELETLDAYVSEEASVVLVTTGTQEAGVSYMITAGTEVMDTAGNAVISGTSDSAVFEGGLEALTETEEEHDSADEEEEVIVVEDLASPEIDDVESDGVTSVIVTFNEEVMLPEDIALAFELIRSDNGDALEVLTATQGDDLAVVTLETAEQDPGEDYILTVSGVTDLAGNELTNTFDRTASFKAVTLDIADLLPPEDVTEFIASLFGDGVELNWTASVNTAGDLDDQLLYQSEDGGDSYGSAESLGANATSHSVEDLEEGATYTFKLTTVDEVGNESEGVITTVTLPTTGAGLGVVLIATALGTGLLHRRKR
ncbi:MAG: hypothetical protein ABII07_05805 [Patescibacteria group bacterium]|nr:hypothetical protein [Patescibacteria group bacterium]